MRSVTKCSVFVLVLFNATVYSAECIIEQRLINASKHEYAMTFNDLSCLNDYINQKTTDSVANKIDKNTLDAAIAQEHEASAQYVNQQLIDKIDKKTLDSAINQEHGVSVGYTDQQLEIIKGDVDTNTHNIKDNRDYTYIKGWDVYNKVMSVLSGNPNLLEIDYDLSCQPPTNYNVYLAALGNDKNKFNSDTAYFKVNTQYPSFITLSSWDGSGDAMAAGVGIAITTNGGQAVDVGSKVFVTRESQVCDINNSDCTGGDLGLVRRLAIANSDKNLNYSGAIYNKNNTGNARIVWPWELNYNPFADNHDTYGQTSPYQFTKPYGYIQVHCG